MRMGGHIPVVGLLDGFDTSINALTLLHQQVILHGMEVGSTQDFVAMNEALETYNIHPIIDKTFPLEQTQAAFKYLEQGLHFGKVVQELDAIDTRTGEVLQVIPMPDGGFGNDIAIAPTGGIYVTDATN